MNKQELRLRCLELATNNHKFKNGFDTTDHLSIAEMYFNFVQGKHIQTKPEVYSSEEVREFLKFADDPESFIENMKIPETSNSFRLYDHQKEMIKMYQSNELNMVVSSEVRGCTTLNLAYSIWYTFCNENSNVVIITDNNTKSKSLSSKLYHLIVSLPDWIKPTMKQSKTINPKTIEFENGSRIFVVDAKDSVLSIRGINVDLAIIDEADIISDTHFSDTLSILDPTLCKMIIQGKGTNFKGRYSRIYWGNNGFAKMSFPAYERNNSLRDIPDCKIIKPDEKEHMFDFIENMPISHCKLGDTELKLYDHQKRMLELYNKYDHLFIAIARQSGSTYINAAYALWYALYHDQSNIAIVVNKSSIKGTFHDRIVKFLETLQNYPIKAYYDVTDGFVFSNGSKITIITNPDNFNSFYDLVIFDSAESNSCLEEYGVFDHKAHSKVIIQGSGSKEQNFYNELFESNNSFITVVIPWYETNCSDEKASMLSKQCPETFEYEYNCKFK